MGLFDFLKKKSQQDIKNDDTALRMAQEETDKLEDKPEDTSTDDASSDSDVGSDSSDSSFSDD